MVPKYLVELTCSNAGVPNLFHAVYLFSIPTDEICPSLAFHQISMYPFSISTNEQYPKISFDKIFGHDYSRIYLTMSR